MARSVGILNKLTQTFPQIVTLQFYYAIAHLLLSYGIYGKPCILVIQRKSSQNRAIRAVVGAHSTVLSIQSTHITHN